MTWLIGRISNFGRTPFWNLNVHALVCSSGQLLEELSCLFVFFKICIYHLEVMIAMVTKMAIVVVRPMVLVTMMVTDKSLMQLSDKQLCDKPLRGVCRRSLAVAAGARCSLYNTQCSANKRYRVASGSRAAVKIGVGIHESGRMHTPSNHHPPYNPSDSCAL